MSASSSSLRALMLLVVAALLCVSVVQGRVQLEEDYVEMRPRNTKMHPLPRGLYHTDAEDMIAVNRLSDGFTMVAQKSLEELSGAQEQEQEEETAEVLPRALLADNNPNPKEIDAKLKHKYYEITVEHLEIFDYPALSSTEDFWIAENITNEDDSPPLHYVELGFDFPFYGHEHDKLWIDPNGYITFYKSHCFNYYCRSLNVVRFIAPLMTDFDASGSGTIKYYISGDGVFTAMWDSVPIHNASTLGRRNFTEEGARKNVSDVAENIFSVQVKLYKNGKIELGYYALPFNPNHFVPSLAGIEDAVLFKQQDADVFIRYAFGELPLKTLMNSWKEAQEYGNRVLRVTYVPTPTCPAHDGNCKDCTEFAEKQKKQKSGLDCGYCPYDKKCVDTFGREIQKLHSDCLDVLLDLPDRERECGNATEIVDELVANYVEPGEQNTASPNNGAEVAGIIILVLAVIVILAFVLYKMSNRQRAIAQYSRQLQNPSLAAQADREEVTHASQSSALEMEDVNIHVPAEDQLR